MRNWGSNSGKMLQRIYRTDRRWLVFDDDIDEKRIRAQVHSFTEWVVAVGACGKDDDLRAVARAWLSKKYSGGDALEKIAVFRRNNR